MLARPDPASAPLPLFAIPVDENGFVDWLIDARPGDTLVYYRGHLSHDRMPSVKVCSTISSAASWPKSQTVSSSRKRRASSCPCSAASAGNEWLYLAIRTRGPLRTTHNHKPSDSSARSLAHA